MSDVFTLYCWVRGTDINQHFGVKISRTENVNALKTLMKQSCPNTFHDVDAAALQLYKPRDPVPAPLDKNLSGFILSEHADMLDGMNKLSALFVVPPPEEHIHIIVDAPFLEIFCWLRGDEVENSFAIPVSANTKMSQLVKQIKGARSDLSAVDDVHMRLYKVSADDDRELQESLRNPEAGDRLDGRRLLSTSFLDVPVLQNYYVIVEVTAERDADKAVATLNQKHSDLFRCLQITVMKLKRWSKEDVVYNMKGGDFWSHGEARSDVITNLERELADRRTYNSSVEGDDLQNAQNKDATRFEGSFLLITNAATCSVKDKREFTSFFNVLRCHVEDAQRIADDRSSHLKAATCLMHFIVPPFFSSLPPVQPYRLKVELSWDFPMFISTLPEPNNWCKYTPNSDISVTSLGFLCPFVLCEVVSEATETDRWRMLIEAIAAVRAGYYITKSGSADDFFVVAIYIRANLTAERYILVQTASNGKVSIAQKDFDLTDSDEAVDFLREMYNLTTKIDALARGLDPSKKSALIKVAQVARPVISLTEQAKRKKTKTNAGSTMGSIVEEDGPQESDYFADPEIGLHLEEMGYELEGVIFGHEHVAMISKGSDRGILKFTRREKEVQILQHLAGIADPANHTITGVQAWKLQSGGYVLYMESGGGHLTSLQKPDLWSTAEQLIEAIAFMHRHGVAHLDIKPQNILIPVDGGRLSIIDFSIAVLVKNAQTRFKGVGGTEGYIAPEVAAGRGSYDAIRADLWSCGKTLQELCLLCTSSPDRKFLLGIALQLMCPNPTDRPVMSQVVKWLADHRALPECPPTRFSPTIPTEVSA